ncbi:MAG: beta-ketoacyl-[acyl-carrier-protein] synthase family protein [Crocinitomicaceae bacterium]|nr:beta-ketoacyl-[acyl-carrier-protein] synthase family protein [Crocinitomicaceae bacterium]
MKQSKVYILDHELVSPIALGRNDIIENIKAGTDACGKIENFDVTGLPFNDGAEVRFDLKDLLKNEPNSIQELSKIDRKLELLAAAFHKGADRFSEIIELANPARTGVYMGVGAESIPLEMFEGDVRNFLDKKLNAVIELISKMNEGGSAIGALSNPHDLYAVYLAEKFNAKAFQNSILTACVSSTQAIAHGYDAILNGDADVVIAGGTDSILNMISLISFGKLGVIPVSDGSIACLPFDINRKGTSSGEAAGFVIMASKKFVEENNLEALVSICGYGNTLDGYKITAPDPEGISMAKAIKDAIAEAGILAEEVDYYYAHGTGTRQNDGTELNAMKNAFGVSAKNIPISSTKDRHGHAIAAAGVQELCILIELMQHSHIPKNLNLQTPIDEEMNLLQEDLSKPIKYAVKSNFAFGGINTVLAVKNEQL